MGSSRSIGLTSLAICVAVLAPAANADIPMVDTGTLNYWDGNLPARFVYKTLSATTPDVDTGTMDYTDESGLIAQYIFKGFRGPGPSVTGWFSIRTHSAGVGAMALELSTSSVTSEPRRDGIQEIQVVFSGPVEAQDGNLDVSDVTVSGVAGGAKVPSAVSLSMDGLTLFIDFALGVLPDKDTYTFDITGKFVGESSGLAVEAGSSSLVCVANGLVGDVNNSGSINLIDVGAIRAMKNNTVNATNFPFDITLSGAIDLIDAALARSNHGNLVP